MERKKSCVSERAGLSHGHDVHLYITRRARVKVRSSPYY